MPSTLTLHGATSPAGRFASVSISPANASP
jgi:hypothetical protein